MGDFYLPYLHLRVKILIIFICILGLVFSILTYNLVTLKLYMYIYILRRI